MSAFPRKWKGYPCQVTSTWHLVEKEKHIRHDVIMSYVFVLCFSVSCLLVLFSEGLSVCGQFTCSSKFVGSPRGKGSTCEGSSVCVRVGHQIKRKKTPESAECVPIGARPGGFRTPCTLPPVIQTRSVTISVYHPALGGSKPSLFNRCRPHLHPPQG